MVSRGARPEYRKGTTGRPYRRFRKAKVAGATNCCYCHLPFVTDAPCTHPTHQRHGGCTTHPQYPTLEHFDPLVRGGATRDPSTTGVACYRCNSTRGAALRWTRVTPLQW
jgi:hypothetical protein